MGVSRPWLLIVEDEPEICEMLTQRFEAEEFRVVSCQRENEAIAKIKNQDFGCIILDLHLKQGSGEKIIEYIDENIRKKHPIPIVVMSGHLDVDLIKDLRGKIHGAFVKPFDPGQLVAKVKSLIPVI